MNRKTCTVNSFRQRVWSDTGSTGNRLKAVSHLKCTGREFVQTLGQCTRRFLPFGNENTSAINEISGGVWQDVRMDCPSKTVFSQF
ncbi:hypothetical protein Y032_0459g1846 [Ancylostoma ceylanicum]|uniref:Uncharacterized protein n=1 Tax=Ancylostoma ceylanicum TaxID=53326 RepID=A0A016WY61_9BILA|nr:hypothetical protein Y032_0459g1846 [Ancylostoma ceylanicum]